MPWKDKERAKADKAKYYQENKERLDKINLKARKKWMKDNPEKARDQSNKEYRKNGLPRQRVWQQNNRARLNELERIRVDRLDDSYLKKQMVKIGYNREELETHPEMVGTYKQLLKIKRFIRHEEHN